MLADELYSIKESIYSIIKVYKKKVSLLKEEKLALSKIETKSNNLKFLADDLLTSLHGLAVSIDELHQIII